jgi:hypothetical protein
MSIGTAQEVFGPFGASHNVSPKHQDTAFRVGGSLGDSLQLLTAPTRKNSNSGLHFASEVVPYEQFLIRPVLRDCDHQFVCLVGDVLLAGASIFVQKESSRYAG